MRGIGDRAVRRVRGRSGRASRVSETDSTPGGQVDSRMHFGRDGAA